MKKLLFSVDLHHQVLIPWAEWKQQDPEPFPPAVLSLDHHLDVVRAFRDDTVPVEAGSWRDLQTVSRAVEKLKHDEHFDWAVQSGLVQKVVIASHTRFTEPANENLIVRCDPLWPDENIFFQNMGSFRSLADSVLESSYLERQFGSLDQYGCFILDIDCDYFLTAASLHPEDAEYFSEMVKKAVLITVSLESDWVRILRLPGENITGNSIKNELFSKFEALRT